MQYYKTTKRDGMSFHGNVKYEVGKTVRLRKCDNPQLCSADVLHASPTALDAIGYANTLDCNLYVVAGDPVVSDKSKSGFFSLKVLREIPDNEKDALLGFRYNEALHPVDPFSIESDLSDMDIANLHKWASVGGPVGASVWVSVRASVGGPVRDSVRDSIWDSVRDSIWDSIWDSVRDSIWDSVRDSIWDSVWDSVGAYVGSLFPAIEKWHGATHAKGDYPYRAAVDLWKRGFIPVKVNSKLRLYHPVRGEPAKLVYQED